MLKSLIPGTELKFHYTNHRGVTEARHAIYAYLEYGEDDLYYPKPTLRLRCFCVDRKAQRSFAIESIEPGSLEIVNG